MATELRIPDNLGYAIRFLVHSWSALDMKSPIGIDFFHVVSSWAEIGIKDEKELTEDAKHLRKMLMESVGR